jgi:hypothetical protein
MATRLVQVRCSRCRGQELFPAAKVGKSVACGRLNAPRFKLPEGTPFGADEWDACRVPLLLRQCLERQKITPPQRANAAFAAAMVRAVYPKSRSTWLRQAVAYAEKFLATSTGTSEEIAEILDGLMQGQPPWVRPGWAMAGVCCISDYPLGWPMCAAADAKKPALVADLIRDVMPNPFRPRRRWSAWRTSTVVALASLVRAEQRVDLLPILADALEDAGCDAHSALAHLRSRGPHTRACWVVEAILGKP